MAAQQLKVFVSHSHEDDTFCHAAVAALRGAGADVWYDEHNLGSGRLHEEILRELGQRPIFVVILSKAAMASHWVKRETDWAEELKERDPSRLLLPVTAGQIERNDFGTDNGWLAYFTYKRIEASGFAPFPTEEAARRLVRTLGLTPAGEAPVPVAPQPGENVDVLLARGKAFVAQDKYAEVLPVFERASQLAPGSFDAWANLGLARIKMGRYGEAVQACDRALALDDKQAWVWNNKGSALNHLERHQEALQAIDRALALDETAVRWNNKGKLLRKLGRSGEALVAYDRALALDPNDRDTWYSKGNALYGVQRYEEALKAYDRALALDPHFASAWTNRGKTLSAMKRYEESIAAYEKGNPSLSSSADTFDATDFQGLIRALRALGRKAEAEAVERRAKEMGW